MLLLYVFGIPFFVGGYLKYHKQKVLAMLILRTVVYTRLAYLSCVLYSRCAVVYTRLSVVYCCGVTSALRIYAVWYMLPCDFHLVCFVLLTCCTFESCVCYVLYSAV